MDSLRLQACGRDECVDSVDRKISRTLHLPSEPAPKPPRRTDRCRQGAPHRAHRPEPNGVPGGAARRNPCVHSRGAGRHARRWCKSLNPSASTRRLARNDAFFHRLFHSFCGFPPDGFAFPSSGDDPAVEQPPATGRGGRSVQASVTKYTTCSHGRHRGRGLPDGCGGPAASGRRKCFAKGRDHAARRRINSPSTDGREYRRAVVAGLPQLQSGSCVDYMETGSPRPADPQRLETPRGRADFLGVGTGAEHGALRRVRRRPRQRPQACAAPGGGVCAVETWTAGQARLGGNRSRRRRLSGYRGAESSRSLSARSHQTDPKLTNGPPSIAMRVRTW